MENTATTLGAAGDPTDTPDPKEASFDTRERILGAALVAFAARGFDGAKMREIALDADVNLGLIQYHFGGKLKLWQAAVDRAFEQLGGGLDTVLTDTSVADDEERARMLIRTYVRFVAQNPEFVRLMHDEGKRTGPRMCWLVDKHVKPMFAAISQLLERSSQIRFLSLDIPPIHYHYIIAGAVGLIFHQAEECKRLAGVDPFDEATIENHVVAVEYLLFGPPSDIKKEQEQ
jgi:AcrR family transcriptional regulator